MSDPREEEARSDDPAAGGQDSVQAMHAPHMAALGKAVAAAHGIWIAPATPGYQRLPAERTVGRRGGETLRRALDGAAASGADYIGLISWNQFADGTQVEPSRRHGTAALETTWIEAIEDVDLDDLHPESLWKFRVNGFGPLLVAMDSHGESLYTRVKTAAQQRRADALKRLGVR